MSSTERKIKARLRSAAWARANPEKRRANSVARYTINRDKTLVRQKAWRDANLEKSRACSMKWQRANAEKVRAYKSARYKANRESVLADMRLEYEINPERKKANTKAWRKANPERAAALGARRRAREVAATVPLTPQEQAKVIGIYAEARALSEIIGIQYHVDHIIPLSKGGLHHPNNLQVLRGVDNLRKGAKLV